MLPGVTWCDAKFVSGMPRLRIIFFGTAELACPSLVALEHPAMEIVAVVTQPDRPQGRDCKLRPSPVKVTALARHLDVRQPERARNPQFIAELGELRADLVVVAAYGQILPAALLELPRFGCLNVHTSLLPNNPAARLRSMGDLERRAGDRRHHHEDGRWSRHWGVSSPKRRLQVHPSDNAQTLHDRLAAMGADLLLRTIPPYVAGDVPARKQPEQGLFYARKITKEDGRIDWSLPARQLWNRVRAFTPWPGAYTFLSLGTRQGLLKIWDADEVKEAAAPPGQIVRADKHGIVVACGQEALGIRMLQKEGGRRLSAAEFLAGHSLVSGQNPGLARCVP